MCHTSILQIQRAIDDLVLGGSVYFGNGGEDGGKIEDCYLTKKRRDGCLLCLRKRIDPILRIEFTGLLV